MEPMKKCARCGGPTAPGEAPDEVTIAGAVFTATLPVAQCRECREVYFDGAVLARFEARVARELARRGAVSGEAFRFMRKALGLPAKELAALLDVAAETVSRWERGERPVDRAAWTVLGALVNDHLEGRATTMKMLRAQQDPAAPEARVVVAA